MWKMDYSDKDAREQGVDGGYDDLRAHDCGEAAIQRAESLGNLIATERIEIVRNAMFFTAKLKLRINKQPDRHNEAYNQKCKLSGCPAGELGKPGQIMHLAF